MAIQPGGIDAESGMKEVFGGLLNRGWSFKKAMQKENHLLGLLSFEKDGGTRSTRQIQRGGVMLMVKPVHL